MNLVDTGDNTQRVISNDKLIGDSVKTPMTLKKKVFIGVAIFLIVGASVGLALGLYFHFRPSSTHIMTTVSQTSDGTVYSSTKFIYNDKNVVEDDVSETFTIMYAGVNSSDTQRRMLQAADGQEVNVDTTLHYTHESGIQIKFRGNEILNISVPIDQVVEYIAQQEDGPSAARLLEAELTQYEGQNETFMGSDLYNAYRAEIQLISKQLFGNSTNIHIQMNDLAMFELEYNENLGKYKYTNGSAELARRRRLWFLSNFFHKVGNFFSNVGRKVVGFVKRQGPTILKYGALALFAGIDIAAKGPSGISDAVEMFRRKNIALAAELAIEGVATRLPPFLELPIDFVAKACFSNPPQMHCTKQSAIKAAEEVAIDFAKKEAIKTVVSLIAQ